MIPGASFISTTIVFIVVVPIRLSRIALKGVYKKLFAVTYIPRTSVGVFI